MSETRGVNVCREIIATTVRHFAWALQPAEIDEMARRAWAKAQPNISPGYGERYAVIDAVIAVFRSQPAEMERAK